MRGRIERKRQIDDPPIGADRDGVHPGQWRARGLEDQYGLPPGCPVHPLGVDGQTFYFIDDIGQLFTVPEGRQFGQDVIQRLFGSRPLYLYWAWPKITPPKKEGEPFIVTNWRAELVRQDLFQAAKNKGPWNSVERIRGRGAWTTKDGRLVLHCGDVLYLDGRQVDTGEHGEFFYPRRPSIPHPWPREVGDDINPGPKLVEMLRTWSWDRPDVDPLLVLGWIVVAMLGGALEWRPSIFLVGDAGTGKSHLQRLIKAVLGSMLVQATDTTPAGLYQRIGTDALPVGVDELEAEADNRKAAAVVKLARLSASGGLMLRGGQDNSGVEFQARSPFLFSAIVAPALPPQDLSRLGMLTLKELDPAKVATPPVLEAIDTIGPRMLRRLMDRWGEWPELLAAYKAALFKGGHDTRGQDTYGTLLAAAHLLLGDEAMAAAGVPSIDKWGVLLGVDALPDHVRKEQNWRKCVMHILTSRVPSWRHGQRQTIGQLLEDLQSSRLVMDGGLSFDDAVRQMGQAGIGLFKDLSLSEGLILAVPNNSPLLAELFEGSQWAGTAGTGGWAGSLRQGPPHVIVTDKKKNNRKVAGLAQRCTLILLDEFLKMVDV
ncbi:hypothetical protein MKI84_12950 [Ancylobacter sp. A5.8]|uniref:hypothetical protein n=1 Tax=Ancylobacter gelatini TaxID=2919920 RepID=UPI001F4E068E|nr:hypothetical protein [Ancylobacter gelatini]MCJ8143825.1 hypothetical protein [Ancylobacter gelatini]